MRYQIAVALMLSASAAFAQDTNVGVNGGAGAVSGSTSSSNSNSNAGATSSSQNANNNQQGQDQGQTQKQGQRQDASNSNVVSPNQQIQFNTTTPERTTVRYEGSTTQRFAPSIVAPVLNPTVPCVAAWTGGGSGIGFGFTIGGSIEDKECTRREFARVLQIIGQSDAAMAVLCGGDIVSKAAPAMCKKIMQALESADIPPVVMAATGTAVVPRPVAVVIPEAGAIEGEIKKTDTGTYRFQGKSWVPITDEDAEKQMLKAAQADVIEQRPLANNEFQPQPVRYVGSRK